MILTNYHTHCHFCDGRGAPEEYAQAAVAKGFRALGFSSHAPVPVANSWTLTQEALAGYLAEIERLKTVWAGRLEIYKGLEIDYIAGVQHPADPGYAAASLDYRAGSVHSPADLDRNPEFLCVDGPPDHVERLLAELYGGSFAALSAAYYERVTEMVQRGGFDFVGHLDLVKKPNRDGRFFSEDAPWYRQQVEGALRALAASGLIMELNSGAIARGTLNEIYPSPWILPRARELGIRVMINADAHRPGDVDCAFERMRAALLNAGYRETWALLDNQWVAHPL